MVVVRQEFVLRSALCRPGAHCFIWPIQFDDLKRAFFFVKTAYALLFCFILGHANVFHLLHRKV